MDDDSDYWYDHRNELMPDQAFRMKDGSIVMLDRRVPGDGTAWYVLDRIGDHWSAEDSRIEPGDLEERLPDLEH